MILMLFINVHDGIYGLIYATYAREMLEFVQLPKGVHRCMAAKMWSKMQIMSSSRHIIRLFPILKWSRTYNLEKGIGDLIAGITIALTLIPQSMGYAMLAGLQPQYGLYGSFMGGFMYTLMGTVPQINIGPTALLSLLTFTYTNGMNVDFAVLLCLIAGIVQVSAAILQLGFLVEFISLPVVSGFTSAAALTVASSQIKGLLGLKFQAGSFTSTWIGVYKHIGETRMADAILSLCCCMTLTGMQNLKKIPIKQGNDEQSKRRAARKKKTLWFLGISRNAVVVLLATVIAAIVYNNKEDPFILTGEVIPGLQTPKPPPFKTVVGDQVYTVEQMLSHLGVGLLVVPLVGILGNVAIAKAFSKGKRLKATQEILALGVCNIVNSFFVSMPVNGSISRSAVSDASGVRTPAAGLYTGTTVILTLVLLTPYFYYIPRAALSSVIVCAVLHMVDTNILKKLWKYSRLDLIPLVASFFGCLAFGIAIGLLCGIATDVFLILYFQHRPTLNVQYVNDGTLPPHYALHLVGGFTYPGADSARKKLHAIKQDTHPDTTDTGTTKIDVEANAGRSVDHLVIYCDHLHRLDYTFLESLMTLVVYWCHNGRVIFCNVPPALKEKLSNAIQNITFCESQQLINCLIGTDDTPSKTT